MELYEIFGGQSLADAIDRRPDDLAKARADRPDWMPDLSNSTMQGWNFAGLDLHGANLHGADMTFINLTGANLRDADLRASHLSGSLLRDADLTGAQLHGASLFAADLKGAIGLDLTGAIGTAGLVY